MDHPPSPMGAIPIQDGSSPHSPPRDLRHRMADRYRPSPGYGTIPPGYSQYPPYGAPPHSPYGAPPPHGYPHRPLPGSFPPPPHPPSSYNYGYPPAPRAPPYAYSSGYEGYTGPHSRHPPPFRSASLSRQSQSPPMTQHSPPEKVRNTPSPKSSPSRSPRESTVLLQGSSKGADHVEVERLRAAAAAELTHEEVKPIQSDFHFFVQENVDECRKLAEEEVRKSLREGETLDPSLVNSNLNTRLIRAWESLSKEERDSFMLKEEEDRRRFMEEDEIASRHCATLTARGKSPKVPEKADRGSKEERQEIDSQTTSSANRESTPGGINKEGVGKTTGKESECEDEAADSIRESVDALGEGSTSPRKRWSSTTAREPQSPSKRTRVS